MTTPTTITNTNPPTTPNCCLNHPGKCRVESETPQYDLLAIDELAYVRLDQRAAELLFQILTEREERASIAIASNAPFSESTKTFTDPRLAAAVIDRITFRAHIIETGTTSYRLTTSQKPIS